jgi:hypothetical protein
VRGRVGGGVTGRMRERFCRKRRSWRLNGRRWIGYELELRFTSGGRSRRLRGGCFTL